MKNLRFCVDSDFASVLQWQANDDSEDRAGSRGGAGHDGKPTEADVERANLEDLATRKMNPGRDPKRTTFMPATFV